MSARVSERITDTVRAELYATLERSGTPLGRAAAAYRSGIDTPTGLHERGIGASTAVAATLLVQVRAIVDGVVPTVPSQAAQSLRSARALLRHGGALLDADTLAYLQALVVALDAASTNRLALDAEDRELRRASAALEQLAAHADGVVVCTLPHYWRHPTADRGRRLLKVVSTRRREQTPADDVPEEPVLLRFYPAPAGADPLVLERRFHALLDDAHHQRPRAAGAGREWFITTVEFLDEIAAQLGAVTAGE
jgi:hypothetical protein